ncbi:heavy metal-binding domain-containing protein [Flavobacterium sp.]|uniref:heavy metal-binding domain-containing protein n=1 Tax=Flavobacterium sp. TaxID=239 RepID=UPI0037902CB4
MKKLIIVLSVFLAAHTVGFTQTKIESSKKEEVNKTIYTCSMHPEVVSDKEGKCPKCGMILVKKSLQKETIDKVYVCKMCKGVTSKSPGKCPKCGMDMTLKEGKPEHNHKH